MMMLLCLYRPMWYDIQLYTAVS